MSEGEQDKGQVRRWLDTPELGKYEAFYDKMALLSEGKQNAAAKARTMHSAADQHEHS